MPLRAFALLLISLFTTLASAHPTGVSKVDIRIGKDTVTVTVDVNRNDLFYALAVTSPETMTKAEQGLLNDRIALYFQSRVPITFDRPAPGGMKVLHWNKLSADPSVKMDSLAFADTTIAMRFGMRLPQGATRMDIQAKLFAELPVQPLAHVRVLWGDSGKEKVINRRFLGLDGRMVMPIVPDSLAAMAARLDADPARPTDAGGDEHVFVRFLRLGFLHILPYGLDHILFVLGLFFFSTALRPLLIQVTAFTIAHSITLGLALVGVVSLPATLVEPLISLSIAVVALENIFFRRLNPSRWIIVFGFGLIHGMGFAGVLRGLGLPEGQFLSTLVGFNLGVEGGQIAVISLAFAATFWARNRPWYFRFVVVPVSAAIALVGLYWTVQRVTGG